MHILRTNFNQVMYMWSPPSLFRTVRHVSSLNGQLPYSAYQPKNVENADLSGSKYKSNSESKYSLLFPPPNVTGNIHLGHALTATIQDILIRWKQKTGSQTVWVPGIDHAGIATQVVVEKILHKELGVQRHDLGRKKFIDEVWKWKNDKGFTISSDLKRLGTSFNWDREYFTMNKQLSKAVDTAFIQLFEKGLIYRDKALINWSCSLESAISDIEVDSLELKGETSITVPGYDKNIIFGRITDFAYKIPEHPNEEIVVSTTRPETMLGDVAVAVHPNDSRYSHLQDKPTIYLWHPFRAEPIPLIFDESVDPEFGTGAVKITPAHDKHDFDIARRHNLKHIQVINEKGLIAEDFGGFSGVRRFLARDQVIESLSELGLFRGTKSHEMILPTCSRSKDVIEYLLRPQWYVKCDDMAKKAVKAVENGDLKIIPANFENEWYRWLNNSRDWCISRQLWWGHQVPAYEVSSPDTENFWVAAQNYIEAKEKAEKKLGKASKNSNIEVSRDPDVLDTWFSSGLLPFSVFNWPDLTEDLKRYYPLDLMETGHDILFFWVARMVMLSQELTNQLPFNKILLHGIICDAHGRKMSKSLGNVIVPDQIINGATLADLQLETEKSFKMGILSKSEMERSVSGQRKMFPNGIPECGIDALRFTLCSYNIKNHFINFDVTECHTNKLFFNKIWQATKYTISCADRLELNLKSLNKINDEELFSLMDRWILSKLSNTLRTVEISLEDYNFHLATNALKTFFYSNLCDVYLETTKMNIHTSGSDAINNCRVLAYCLASGLARMEIFTPFLVNEIKKYLPSDNIKLDKFIDNDLESETEKVLEICGNIRQLQNEFKISKKQNPIVHIVAKSSDYLETLENYKDIIKCLTVSTNVHLVDHNEFEATNFLAKSTAGHFCSFGISSQDASLQTKKSSSLNEKKLLKLQEDLEKMKKVVENDGYKKSASPQIQQKHLKKIYQLKMEIDSIRKM